jgi:hypothetical protein
MNITDILHKRVLVAEKTGSYGNSSKVTEFLIMEISPSHNFVKVRDFDGRRYWRARADIQVIEILDSIEDAPQKPAEAVVNSI